MEIDPLGTPYRLGRFPKGGGQAELVHSTNDYELEVFLYRPCHGDAQICILYVNGQVHSLSLMDDLTDAWVFILNCKWPDGHSGGRDLWQDIDPLCSLAPGKRQLEKPLVSGWNTGSIGPLDKSLFTAVCKSWGVFLVLKEMGMWVSGGCESVEVVTPAPTWLSPGVHDARQLPSRLCLCGANAARWAPTRCTSLVAGRGRSSSGGVVCMEMALSAWSTPRPSPTALLLSTLMWELLLLLLASVQGTGLGTKGTPVDPDRSGLTGPNGRRIPKVI